MKNYFIFALTFFFAACQPLQHEQADTSHFKNIKDSLSARKAKARKLEAIEKGKKAGTAIDVFEASFYEALYLNFAGNKVDHKNFIWVDNCLMNKKEERETGIPCTEVCLEKPYLSAAENYLKGDINKDGFEDAIIRYIACCFGCGGNAWNSEYALVMGSENGFIYKSSLEMGSKFSEELLIMENIKADGTVKAYYRENSFEEAPKKKREVSFYYREGTLISK